ncbi:MAG: hypothetical protein WBK37_02570 [Kiritimatiellia bacterium]|nr:hypothetical protein [Kiritimatiellia bacterium]
MRKLVLLSIIGLCAGAWVAGAADANLELNILSAYVNYGQVGNDEAVFQPSFDVAGPYGFGFNLWANMDLTDNARSWWPNTAGEWSELNLELNWTAPLEGPVSLTLGGVYFAYPQQASEVLIPEDSGEVIVQPHPADGGYEVYILVEAEDVLLSPRAQFYHDLGNADDWHAELAIGHTIELTAALSLDLTAILGMAGKYYVEDNFGSDAGDAITHAQFEATLNYALNEKITLGLTGAFMTILDSDIRDDVKESDIYPDVDFFFGGLTIGYTF